MGLISIDYLLADCLICQTYLGRLDYFSFTKMWFPMNYVSLFPTNSIIFKPTVLCCFVFSVKLSLCFSSCNSILNYVVIPLHVSFLTHNKLCLHQTVNRKPGSRCHPSVCLSSHQFFEATQNKLFIQHFNYIQLKNTTILNPSGFLFCP